MAQGFGHNLFLGFGQEVTYGTSVASTKWIEVNKINLSREQKRLAKDTLRFASQRNNVKGKRTVQGGFEAPFNYAGLEILLKHAFGSVGTSGAGPYEHTFTPTAALPVGLSFHVSRDAANVGAGSAFKYEGCQISKLTLRQQAEDFLMVAIEVVGEDGALENVETPTYPTFSAATWEEFTLEINGVATAVEDFELSIENNLASDRFKLGSAVRKGLGRSGPRKVTGSFTQEFDSKTDYETWYHALTQTSIEAIWYQSANVNFSISCSSVVLTAPDPEVSDGGPIKAKVTFEAFAGSATEGSEVSAVLTNATVSVP